MANSEKVNHSGHRTRLRQKFLNEGFNSLSEHEILELLLFYCIPRKNTNHIAHILMDKYKTLANIFDATPIELMKEEGIGDVAAAFLTMIPKLAQRYEKSKEQVTDILASTEDIGKYAISMFKDKQKIEELDMIVVNSNRRVKWSGMVRNGTVDKMDAYPRDVVEIALVHKAKSLILVHNHPNGSISPSFADKEATEILVRIFKSIGIEVLDHIIVSGTRYFSMKEAGFRF